MCVLVSFVLDTRKQQANLCCAFHFQIVVLFSLNCVGSELVENAHRHTSFVQQSERKQHGLLCDMILLS